MVYRLASERINVGPEDGPEIEVERLAAWPIYRLALRRAAAFTSATDGSDAELEAYSQLLGFFVLHAQPTFAIIDHLGVVPATHSGMLRLPVPLVQTMIDGWLRSFSQVAEEPTSAVDEIIAPGVLREQLKAGLRTARRRKAA